MKTIANRTSKRAKPFTTPLVWLRKDKRQVDGKCPIYLRIRIWGKEVKIPTDIVIDENDWNKKLKMPKNQHYVTRIDKLKTNLANHLWTEFNTDAEITTQTVKDFLAGKKKVKPEQTPFFEYFDEFLKRKKDYVEPGTIDVYNVTYNALKELAPNLKIADINYDFICKFDAFLRKKGNIDSTRRIRHLNLKAVLLEMPSYDINIKDPYLRFKMPKSSVKKDVYLDTKELDALENLAKNIRKATMSKKDQTLLMFLFGCHTGLRIGDVFELRWSDVDMGKKLIFKKQKKTKGKVTVVMTPAVARILIKFATAKLMKANELVFKSISRQTIATHLRELAIEAKIEKDITFHTSRHTFATNLVLDGYDLTTIRILLGQKDLKSTERYLSGDEQLVENYAKQRKAKAQAKAQARLEQD